MCLVQQKIFFPTVKYFQVNFFLEKKVVYGCIPENIIENIFSIFFFNLPRTLYNKKVKFQIKKNCDQGCRWQLMNWVRQKMVYCHKCPYFTGNYKTISSGLIFSVIPNTCKCGKTVFGNPNPCKCRKTVFRNQFRFEANTAQVSIQFPCV